MKHYTSKQARRMGDYEGSRYRQFLRQRFETSDCARNRVKGPSGRADPTHHVANTNILRFALGCDCTGAASLLFGLLFVVVIGGTDGMGRVSLSRVLLIFIIGGVRQILSLKER